MARLQAYRILDTGSAQDDWTAKMSNLYNNDENTLSDCEIEYGFASPQITQFVRRYAPTLFIAFLISLLFWGSNALSTTIRVDVEHFINNPGTMQGWLTIGRWGQPVIKAILGTTSFNPLFSGILFLVAWPMSGVAWIILIELVLGKQLKSRVLFLLPYLLANWWSYMFYFFDDVC